MLAPPTQTADPRANNAFAPPQSRARRSARNLVWRAWLVVALIAASGCANLPANVDRPTSRALVASSSTNLGQMVMERRASSAARADSSFALLSSVEQAYGTRLALIDASQKTLDLQYYAIHADGSTERLLERLHAAAARGVRVRILLDDFNTVGRDAQVLRLGFEPNIELRLFNPLPGSRRSLLSRLLGSLDDIPRIQQRMHNKLFIADNALGITGGRNIGDAYFGQDKGSNFVDLDILAAGRVVTDMSASFDHYWNNDLAYPVQSLMTLADLEKLDAAVNAKPDPPSASEKSPAQQQPSAHVPAVAAGAAPVLPEVTPTVALADAGVDLRRITLTWAPAVLMADKPGKIGPDTDEVDAQDTLIDGLLQLMDQTRREMVIISPYFVPGRPMMDVFAQLRARGVRIRVLTNSLASNDAPAAHAGYARYRRELLHLGVELYEMRSAPSDTIGALGSSGSRGGSSVDGSKSGSRASLHSKALVMDGRLFVIGSMNLDLRSQLQNTEVALVIRSASLASQALRMIEKTLDTGAYRLEDRDGRLHWKAPAGASFSDADTEPDAGLKLRLLVRLIAPFAPDDML